MTANNSPIERYSLGNSPVTIRYSLAFEIEEARAAAGLSRAEFEALPGVPGWGWSKSDVVVWHRYHRLVKAVAEHAEAQAAKRRRR